MDKDKSVKLFLLAHQDDEVFLLPFIADSEKKLFIYLTNGSSNSSSVFHQQKRTNEAHETFKEILMPLNANVIWWGNQNGVSEGELHKFANSNTIRSLIESISHHGTKVSKIYTTTFEGAHQDHDSAAVIARIIRKSLGADVIEVSTYPQKFKAVYSFSVMSPKYKSINFDFDRLKILRLAARLILSYRTQWKTWLGLTPAIVFSYLFTPFYVAEPQVVQVLDKCFYHFRSRAKQEEVILFLENLEAKS
jgi:hypothetical protein